MMKTTIFYFSGLQRIISDRNDPDGVYRQWALPVFIQRLKKDPCPGVTRSIGYNTTCWFRSLDDLVKTLNAMYEDMLFYFEENQIEEAIDLGENEVTLYISKFKN